MSKARITYKFTPQGPTVYPSLTSFVTSEHNVGDMTDEEIKKKFDEHEPEIRLVAIDRN